MMQVKMILDSPIFLFKYKFYCVLWAVLLLFCIAPYLAWGEITLCEQEKIRESAIGNTADLNMLFTINSLAEPSSKGSKLDNYLKALLHSKTEDSKINLIQLELLNIQTNRDLEDIHLAFDDSQSGNLMQELLANDDFLIDDKMSKFISTDLKNAYGDEGLALFEALFKALKSE